MRLRALALAASSGILWFGAAEPVGAAPLAWIALVPLFVAVLAERRWWWAALYGLVCGLVAFGSQLTWIFGFGWMAWTALTVVLALYVAAAAAVGQLARRLPLAPVLAAGAFVGFELLRDRWPFGGFPWGSLGTTQGALPPVRALAPAIGTYGLAFLVAFAGAVVAERILHGRVPWGSVVLVAVVLAVFVTVDAVRYAPDGPGRRFTVGVVQGDVPRPRVPNEEVRVFRNHLRLTRAAFADGQSVDVIVWPESAVGDAVGLEAERTVSRLAEALDTPMLVGRYESVPAEQAFLNLVDHFDADGDFVGTYQKQHPVPFGEYVPLGFLRGVVGTLDQVPYDMVPGPGPTVFGVDGTLVGTPICFESAFPRDIRAFANEGAEVHVVATNDASFERTPASVQHFAHSRMRALELRQWVVQAAISGISGVISPDGVVSDQTRLFTDAVVRAEVRARPASSLYARWGDVFSLGWTAGTALALALWGATIVFGRRRSDEAELR